MLIMIIIIIIMMITIQLTIVNHINSNMSVHFRQPAPDGALA